MLKAREKETDRRKSERKEKKTEILQKLIHSAKKQQLVLSYSPTLPFLNIIQSFFFPLLLSVILSALLLWVSVVCSAAKL